MEQHYGYLHTQSFASAVDDLTQYCHKLGGGIAETVSRNQYLGKVDDGLPKVRFRRGSLLVGYMRIDMDIAKLHFEIGAGKENFDWAE